MQMSTRYFLIGENMQGTAINGGNVAVVVSLQLFSFDIFHLSYYPFLRSFVSDYGLPVTAEDFGGRLAVRDFAI